ncbi:hypothetical protein FHS16_001899 [Paenibacillus endophyticus]|uniref:Uncharacterized protein n=1 Tax=Paenibacillus endophyticus TaxID=1294268 RepID=A0A7W5GA24_9BACL|nr:hypothetical protein [Paenibacillus endophyticus]MBB3151853.1 hypothetical protein [Paenibacillus endophyticus]
MTKNQKAPFDYKSYWENNDAQSGTSGSGSYVVLADLKADIINAYMQEHTVQSVIE